jgi:ubiquinone/menaquinone biosynthesis C-methylase UbiE
MSVDTLLRSQFGKPSGLLGELLMGPILNWANVRLVNAAIELLEPKPADSVLDIGFGGGYSLVAMAGKVTQGRVTGVDYSREMVESAARLVRDKRLDARVRVQWGDVAELPFRAGTFHEVITVNSLYYWPDLAASLREVARVMKRRGRIAVGFRSPASLRPLTRDWEGFWLYEPQEFAGILGEAGFKVLRVEHRDRWWVLDTVVVTAERR